MGFQRLTRAVRQMWDDASEGFPASLHEYSDEERRKNEEKVSKLFKRLQEQIKPMLQPGSPALLKSKWKRQGKQLVSFLMHQDALEIMGISRAMQSRFFKETQAFFKKARQFDPQLSLEDIGQAMRNVWIICILSQQARGEEPLNSAAFGYSMLYPYTDNYLDDSTISGPEKQALNARLYQWLTGHQAPCANAQEEKIYALVREIENGYDRALCPQVYDSLLFILEGQADSLRQQGKDMDPQEILDISIRKGGASVLADGFIANEKLDDKAAAFCMGFGFLLQLADDIQDIEPDARCGHQTLFSTNRAEYAPHTLVNKMFSFMRSLLDSYPDMQPELCACIEKNCALLVLYSCILNRRHFQSGYIERLTPFLPFSPVFVEGLLGKLREEWEGSPLYGDRPRLMAMIDAVLEEELAFEL